MPLLRENGGVEGFDRSFTIERFIPEGGPSGRISDPEIDYVRRLTEQAEGRGKIPVLTATRSLGRVAGLKAAAPGMHVVLYRSLMQQWCSYTEQAVRGNPYFLETVMEVFRLNVHDPVLSEIRNVFPVQTASETDQNLFCRFVLLHLYLYVTAFPFADMVLDINRASADKTYRTELEARFAAQSVRIDFSAITDSLGCSMLDMSSRDRLLETLRVIGASICDRAGSDEAREFGLRILSDLEKDLDTVEFHTKTIRSLYGRLSNQRTALQAELAAAHAQRETVRTERETVRAELESVRAELETVRAELEAVRRERDEIVAQRLALQADLEGARAAIQAGQEAEAAARAETEAVGRDRDRLRAEWDSAKRASLSAIAEAEVVRQEQRMLSRERDAALEARNEARLAKETYEVRVAEILNWSAAYHQSTARSLSWKLTRPLRWIGIGRPVRPPKPDFFD